MIDVDLSALWYWCLLLLFLIGAMLFTNQYKNRIKKYPMKYFLIYYICIFVLSILFFGILDSMQERGPEYWWVIIGLLIIKLITAVLLSLELHYYFSKSVFKWGLLLAWFVGYDFCYVYETRTYLVFGCLILIQSYRKYRANKSTKVN